MTKLTLEMQYDGYDFSIKGLLSSNGHVEALRITPLGFCMSELDKDSIKELNELAQELLLEKFSCPEIEFEV